MAEKLEDSIKEIVKYRSLFSYELDSALKNKAKEELHEDDETVREVLTQFKDLIAKSEGYSDILLKDEDYFPFLRGAKYDLKPVYTKYLNYVNLFRNYDQLFKHYDFSWCLNPIQSNILCFLPRRDADGCTVILCFFQYWDGSECDMGNIINAAVAGFLENIRCPSTQINGIKIVFDYSGVSIKMVRYFPFWTIKFASEAMQSALPCRLKEYHVVNNGPLFKYLWAILGPLMSRKLRKRVYFHGCDYKSLHKYISPSILPAELGGKLGPQDNSEWLSKLSESKEYITEFIRRARREQ